MHPKLLKGLNLGLSFQFFEYLSFEFELPGHEKSLFLGLFPLRFFCRKLEYYRKCISSEHISNHILKFFLEILFVDSIIALQKMSKNILKVLK